MMNVAILYTFYRPWRSALYPNIFLRFIRRVAAGSGLRCYQCGQYTDGVGSITPCINHTDHHLKECPKSNQKTCIKYVTEGSIVRDCIADCEEKTELGLGESWGTKTFCCTEDACNAAIRAFASDSVILPAVLLVLGRFLKATF
ncbi:Hypothetical protein NTJ_09773 [Nesidiocoris tenuis]|uniref:UPAR/Ly6 domain-containing protein n=1 Tax=Nesidiocoris tenuis TaxID=355587 RepID=A0ABN7B179_9HEMI|nr:Hypothetical protein NTJ_09773 [Nesidiocoris tenuis]